MADSFLAQEMSGLEASIETEPVVEGGENRFVHQLPKAARHANLVLRHFVLPGRGPVLAWLRSVMEGDFSKPIAPQSMTVELLDPDETVLMTWALTNAYPVKWSVAAFASATSDVAVDRLELAFATLKRA